MSTTACSRPTNDVTCSGQVARERESSAARGNDVVGQPGPHELEDALGPSEVAQAVLAEIDEAQTVGERVARQLLGRERHHDLAAVRRRHQARGAVHRGAVVVAVAQLGLTGVHADPHPQRPGRAPRLRAQIARCAPRPPRRRVVRAREHRVHAVAASSSRRARRGPRSRRGGSRRGGRARPASRRDAPPRDASNPRDR